MSTNRSFPDLIPAYYKLRDADPATGDGLLAALLAALQTGIGSIEDELRDRYDDLFVETCAPDELAHFVSLLGIRELPGRRSPRAFVANVLGYRRRKGTPSALEDLARTSSGWTAKATEQFSQLVVATALTHLRPGYIAVASIRDPLPLIQAGTPFDTSARTADIRSVERSEGRVNLPNTTIDLWRLEPVLEGRRAAYQVDDQRFTFNPLGMDQPLYSIGNPEPTIEHRLTRADATAPLGMLEAERSWSSFYGEKNSLVVFEAGVAVALDDTAVCDLSDVGTGWNDPGSTARVAIDPTRGRIAFAVVPAGAVEVGYCRALPRPIGGGGYERPAPDDPGSGFVVVTVAADGTADQTTIEAGLEAVTAGGGTGAVEILDSARYAPATPLDVPASSIVTIRAVPGQWPVVTNGLQVVAGDASVVTLAGLLVCGGAVVVDGSPTRLYIDECTLVPGGNVDSAGHPVKPGQPSLVVAVDEGASTTVLISDSVVGIVRAPRDQVSLEVSGSIVCGESVDSPATQAAFCIGTPLTATPTLTGRVSLTMHLGVACDLTISLVSSSTTIDDLAVDLEDAIRAAGLGTQDAAVAVDTSTFIVAAHADRLVVVGPATAAIGFSDAVGETGTDTTATALGLTTGAVSSFGTIAHLVPDPPGITAGNLQIAASWDRVGAFTPSGSGVATTFNLASVPASLADAAGQLELALGAAAGGAVAFVRDGVLFTAVLLAGSELIFRAGPAVNALGLLTPSPAFSSGAGCAAGGPALTSASSTWLGDVVAETATVTDSIIAGALTVTRRQTGCVRYSWLGDGSVTPRQYRSVVAQPAPAFVSARFGDAGFGQLTPTCPTDIARGAEDGAEMGVFHDVQQPDRIAAVQSLLSEYLRFTARAGIFLVS